MNAPSAAVSALVRHALRILLALLPWSLVLYLHYHLEHGDVWQVDMPFRALISILLLALGMAVSFVIYCRMASRRR